MSAPLPVVSPNNVVATRRTTLVNVLAPEMPSRYEGKIAGFQPKSVKIGVFWLKIGDFSLKNENFKILKLKSILLVTRTNIAKNEPNRTSW